MLYDVPFIVSPIFQLVGGEFDMELNFVIQDPENIRCETFSNSEFLMRKLRPHVCEQENKSNFWLVLKDFAVFLVFTVFFKVSTV
jgi:hypothetical protein